MKPTLALALLFLASSLQAASSTTLTNFQNQVIEWSYSSDTDYTDPFRAVALSALVRRPDGSENAIKGFWAGGREWRFRYASPQVGEHHFLTVSDDSALNGHSGTILIRPYEGDNPLYRHGPLGTTEGRRYLQHYDGTPFLWLADSWWHGMTTRFKWPEDFKQLTADRKQKGFTVIQFAIGFPCDIEPFDSRGQNAAGDPWTPGFGTINPAYFDLVDLRINWLLRQGLVPNVVGLWGYYIKFMGVERVKEHWDYLIARYGAYPVAWTLCGESTLAYYPDLEDGKVWEHYRAEFREQWSEVARHIQNTDPYDRLLTVHPGPGTFDGKPPINDMAALDFVMVQSGHSGFHTLPHARRLVQRFMEENPEKPVLHGEVCFEGMHGGGSGEKVQRYLFWTDMLSGTGGFSYGAEGIWQFNTEESPFGASPGGNTWGNVPWDVASHYPGSSQIGIGRRFFQNLEWWELRPMPESVLSGSQDPAERDAFVPYAAGIGDQIRIAYLPLKPSRYQPVTFFNLTPGQPYQVTWFDPITGNAQDHGTIVPGEDRRWSITQAPISQDWVVVLEKGN